MWFLSWPKTYHDVLAVSSPICQCHIFALHNLSHSLHQYAGNGELVKMDARYVERRQNRWVSLDGAHLTDGLAQYIHLLYVKDVSCSASAWLMIQNA